MEALHAFLTAAAGKTYRIYSVRPALKGLARNLLRSNVAVELHADAQSRFQSTTRTFQCIPRMVSKRVAGLVSAANGLLFDLVAGVKAVELDMLAEPMVRLDLMTGTSEQIRVWLLRLV